jgi:hypothetical protein
MESCEDKKSRQIKKAEHDPPRVNGWAHCRGGPPKPGLPLPELQGSEPESAKITFGNRIFFG